MLTMLLGGQCVLCRELLTGHAADRQLCTFCLASLPWLREPQLHDPSPNVARAIAPLAYEGAPRGWVLDSKTASGLVAARILGTLLAETVIRILASPSERPTGLIPVPLSLARLLLRGHNQAALIATPVAQRLRIPLHHRAARRIRHTALQPGLNATARADNVAGAFASRRDWRGAHVAVVDDVCTTGATAEALARALRARGAASVQLWSATRASPPGHAR